MFHRIKEWLFSHPYLSGGLVLLVVVYFVIRNSSSSSSAQSGVVQTGPSAAQLAANSQDLATQTQATYANNALSAAVAGKQIDANTTLGVANAQVQLGTVQANDASQAAIQAAAFQLAGVQATAGASVQAQQNADQASVAIAGLQYGSGVQIAQIQSNTDLGLATIQAPILELQSNNQLAAQVNIDATSLGIAQANDNANVSINGQNTQRDITVNQSNNDVTNNETAAQLQLGIHGQDVTQNIYTDQINTTGTVDLAEIAAQHDTNMAALTSVNSGIYNKGGEGGVNQITALGNILGFSNQGGPSAAVGTAQSAGSAATYGAFANLAGTALKAIF